jgi:hypothetical protein
MFLMQREEQINALETSGLFMYDIIPTMDLKMWTFMSSEYPLRPSQI